MMQKIFSKESLTNPVILAAVGIVILIAAGSFWYYTSETRFPVPDQSLASTLPQIITASGIVDYAQNPDLSFQAPGRIVRINVDSGTRVYRGQTLASLDTSALSAQRAQAVANLKAQQAKLEEMEAGPRQVDVAVKQTAVDTARAALANLYISIGSSITQAYDRSFNGVAANTDALFNNPNSTYPTLVFLSSNSQKVVDAEYLRLTINGDLADWKKEVSALGNDPQTIKTALGNAIDHLLKIRMYSNTLLEALGSAIESASFPRASVAAGQASVAMLRDSTNASISSLQALQQQVVNAELAIQSATDALTQVLAGPTVQAIDAQKALVESAQASINAIDAQIRNAIIVAPFAGTVSSVHAKVGDMAQGGVPIISLNPESALHITVYLTELDIAKIRAGDAADVTLDAYGVDRHWNAEVISVDSSPTMRGNVAGYKTVLQFEKPDPAISVGMTANITIALAQQQ